MRRQRTPFRNLPQATFALCCTALCCTATVPLARPLPALAQVQDASVGVDTDQDGFSDALEQRLLAQFAPRLMIGQHECSGSPAEFKPNLSVPEVLADNGTIYGQVFPATGTGAHPTLAEIHYYHLWRKDCGSHGHPLDTEHVAVLVHASDTHLASATWQALYWYAAAHENTVCDVSQIARASTLAAVDHGATVWISPGKHASYLNGTLCQRGCGADRCENMVALPPGKLINLGELQRPMNGSVFTAAKAWPLAAKMSVSDFPPAPLARLNDLPDTDIAWFHSGRHPAQGVIARSSHTEDALEESGRNTTAAISTAEASTGNALFTSGTATTGAVSATGASTGNALQKTYRDTRHALAGSAEHVGKALHRPRERPAPAPARD